MRSHGYKVLLVVVLILSSCTTLKHGDLSFEEGAPEDFAGVRHLCVYAYDVDSEMVVDAVIRSKVAVSVDGATFGGECSDRAVTVQYGAGESACTHCEARSRNPRFASATLTVRDAGRVVAKATWVWLHGGTAETAVEKFVRDLTTLLSPKTP